METSTRVEQIEQLAEAWEARGDERTAMCEPEVDGDRLAWLFFHNNDYVAAIGSDNTDGHSNSLDTVDASECLAILRDVKGEEWTISEWGVVGSNACRFWMAHHIERPYEIGKSDVSRIHAVTLALQERNKGGSNAG